MSTAANRRRPPAQSAEEVLKDVFGTYDDEMKPRRKAAVAMGVGVIRDVPANVGVHVLALWKGHRTRAAIIGVLKLSALELQKEAERERTHYAALGQKPDPALDELDAVAEAKFAGSKAFRFEVRFALDETIAVGLHFGWLAPTVEETTKLLPPTEWTVRDYAKLLRELQETESMHRRTLVDDMTDEFDVLYDARPRPPKVDYVALKHRIEEDEASERRALDDAAGLERHQLSLREKKIRATKRLTPAVDYVALRFNVEMQETHEREALREAILAAPDWLAIKQDERRARGRVALRRIESEESKGRAVLEQENLQHRWRFAQVKSRARVEAEEASSRWEIVEYDFPEAVRTLSRCVPSAPPPSPKKPAVVFSSDAETQTPPRKRIALHLLHKPCPVDFRPPFRPSSGKTEEIPSAMLPKPLTRVVYRDTVAPTRSSVSPAPGAGLRTPGRAGSINLTRSSTPSASMVVSTPGSRSASHRSPARGASPSSQVRRAATLADISPPVDDGPPHRTPSYVAESSNGKSVVYTVGPMQSYAHNRAALPHTAPYLASTTYHVLSASPQRRAVQSSYQFS